ncbi:unnamed protein product [Adineta steineri]|uniref:Enoyl reductase (ER) domain-containing protein n=1 Tax=Adineta steineri TaxID=433720 RepID=A0A819Q0G8_9BILA|nr:unnamed protein product [Adineta steineri]CAF4026806.1 unnamed protein product [Adineta steineri]
MSDLKNTGIAAQEGKFIIKEKPYPTPKYNEAIIKVNAVSLNRGEVRRDVNSKEEIFPGWDLSGEVIQAAEDGSGPKNNKRVVGFLSTGAWSQYVAVATNALAELPDDVSDEDASTLPVAGLTALLTLLKGEQLIGKRVLITGSTGGVGVFAIQLAKLSGAYVVALVRNEADVDFIKDFGADEVLVNSVENAEPFDLILDSVGGDELNELVKITKPFGKIISFGNSFGKPVSAFDISRLYSSSVTIYGFILFNELKHLPASEGLSKLVNLLHEKKLKTLIEKKDDWKNIQTTADNLIDRKYKGKAVLYVK